MLLLRCACLRHVRLRTCFVVSSESFVVFMVCDVAGKCCGLVCVRENERE